jgi:hypothetical protein
MTHAPPTYAIADATHARVGRAAGVAPGSARSIPTAESLRQLHHKLDRRCARAAEALAAMREKGAALTRRGPGFSVGHLRLDAAAAAVVLACADVAAVNDLFGNAQTWRWAE